MDRRNGGDPLAPPRPPKLLPRVHRPRAPEPTTMMSESSMTPTAAATTTTTTPVATTPQCTNNNNIRNEIFSGNSSSNQSQQQQHLNSINTATNLRGSCHSINNNNNNNSNSNSHSVAQQHQLLTTPLLRLHQHHHHQHQAQHHHHQQHQPPSQSPITTTNLSRNNSNLSQSSATSATSSTNFTSSNSFTRRRPPPPTPTSPLAARINASTPAGVPLLTLVNGNILSGNFLHSPEPVPVSPVTLAAPRPESERLTNEYVDTPFRTAQQLQHASRTQHPAGQNIQGQTTTQHNLLLQQSQSRQQQQHQQTHQQHSSRVGTAGSATTATATTTSAHSCDRVDAFLHSNSHKTSSASTATATGTKQGKLPTTASSNLQPPPPPARPHALNTQPITQPIITKQPAVTNNNTNISNGSSSATFTKDLHHQHPAFTDDILDLHHIGGISTPPGGNSHSSSIANGTPIIIGGSDVAALNPTMCPRCDRCRCEQCQSPRQLPQTWVCNKTCLCSAETIIDYASCLCCVKALFYHCAKDHEMDCDDGATTLCVDDPCSCLPYKRAQRWSWLGALSLVLPCLWCYWPMRGCAAICEKCYGRYAGQGCRCQQIGSTSSMLPIVPLGINGSGGIGNNNAQNGGNSIGVSKSAGSGGVGHHHHHQRHHSECSAASRILRKCDSTPEKRLLDSSPEY